MNFKHLAVTIAAGAAMAPAASATPRHVHAITYRQAGAAIVARAEARLLAAARAAHVRAPIGLPNQVEQACITPAGDPAFGTSDWEYRDAVNQYCATLRLRDQLLSPSYGYANTTEGGTLYADQLQEQAADGPTHLHGGITTLVPGSQAADAFRTLDKWTAATGGTARRIAFTGADGAQLRGHIFLPPPSVKMPPSGYPGVIITDGSVQAYEQLYYWAAEGLAEAGYEVMTYDVQGQGDSDLLPGSCAPSAASLQAGSVCQGVPYQQSYNFYQGAEESIGYFDSLANPGYGHLDTNRIGITGHSLGAAAVSEVGQCDTRVKTIIAWDNLGAISSCRGGGETIDPQYRNKGALVRVPAISITNDYGFYPQPATAVPNPNAKTAGYEQVVKAGLDAMIVALRGATHLTYTYIPLVLPASELAEREAFYYTLAWFDRYLRGDRAATKHLTAGAFDNSADAHSIGTGIFDATKLAATPTDPGSGNVPYEIAGLPVKDIVSFYLYSEYSLDGGKLACNDMRAGCPAVQPPTP